LNEHCHLLWVFIPAWKLLFKLSSPLSYNVTYSFNCLHRYVWLQSKKKASLGVNGPINPSCQTEAQKSEVSFMMNVTCVSSCSIFEQMFSFWRYTTNISRSITRQRKVRGKSLILYLIPDIFSENKKLLVK